MIKLPKETPPEYIRAISAYTPKLPAQPQQSRNRVIDWIKG